MTEKELVAMLKSTGIPVRYSHFTTPKAAPYLTYHGDGQTVFPASDTVYWKDNNYVIEFYFKTKDPDLEDLIEDVLASKDLIYEKSEDVWIESEGAYSIYYYV